MKKYDAQKAQAKFEKKLNKIARKLDKADEKGHELSIIILRCKIAKLANKRARQMEKFETNGVFVKPDLIFGKEYAVVFKVRADANVEAISPEEADRICGNGAQKPYGTDKNYKVIQTTTTKTEKEEKSL